MDNNCQGNIANQQQQNNIGQPGVALPGVAVPGVAGPAVSPSINVIVPSQLLGTDRLPTAATVMISEGTTFMMNGVTGHLMAQNGQQAANRGDPRRVIWPVGTIFYLNNNPRNQCAINLSHQQDTLPVGCQIILQPGTEINWGGRSVVISQYESTENRTVTL